MKLVLKKVLIFALICMLFSSNLQVYASLDFATSEAAGGGSGSGSGSSGGSGSGSTGTSGGSPGGSGGSSSGSTYTVPTIAISYNYAIEGLVYEDEVSYVEVTDSTVGIPTTYKSNDGIYNTGEPVVSGVQVLNKKGDSYVSLTTTDSNGQFSIANPGEYHLSFKYGYASLDESNYKLNKDTLKYNGQDYKMITTTSGYIPMEKLEYLLKVQQLRDSYTEIMILIDYSNSMRINGNKKLNAVKDAAKEFVNRLFEESEGKIAVGFMAFAYDGVVVKSPTDVKEDVIEGIDKFEVESTLAKYNGKVIPIWSSLNNGENKTGTNIGAAVLKAKEAYLGDDSNKVMVLFSDGAATAHKDLYEPIYTTDSDTTIRNKLTIVAEKTRKDLEEIVDSDITLISILNDTADQDEIYYISKAFTGSSGTIGTKYVVGFDDRDAVEEALLKDVKLKIDETIGKELIVPDSALDVKEGNDNVDRRNTLNAYYKDMNYEKLKLFSVIDKLNGDFNNDSDAIIDYEGIYFTGRTSSERKSEYKSFIESNDVQKFMQNSYMVADSDQTIRLYQLTYDANGHYKTIERPGEVLYRFTYSPAYNVYNDEGEFVRHVGEGYYINGTRYLTKNISISAKKVDFQGALVKRSEFVLELEKRITGVRLTLSDGTVLYENLATLTSGNNTVELSRAIELYNQVVKDVYQYLLAMDKGIYGSMTHSLDVKNNWVINEVEEYVPDTVTLTVDSEILQGATLEVEYTFVVNNTSNSDTINRSLSIVDYYDNGLVYRPDGKLITEDSTNLDYGWKEANPEDLILNSDASRFEDKCVYVDYNELEYRNAESITESGITTVEEVQSKYPNPRIGTGGKRYAKIVLSVVLSADSFRDSVYRNQAEIIGYSNSRSRRMNYTEETTDGDIIYKSPIAGNYIPTKGIFDMKNYNDISNVGEVDTVLARRVSIIPPTGIVERKKTK